MNLPKWAKWMARDEDGFLHVYEEEPEKDEDDEEWVYTENFGRYERVHETSDIVYANREVKWEDGRACEIAPKPYSRIELTIDSEKMMDNLRKHFEELAGIKSSDEPEEEPDDSADMVQKPPHYNKFSFQPIDIIAEVTNYYEGSTAFHIGTVLKYLCRAPFKGKLLEDLKKASYYLTRAIEEMEDDGE